MNVKNFCIAKFSIAISISNLIYGSISNIFYCTNLNLKAKKCSASRKGGRWMERTRVRCQINLQPPPINIPLLSIRWLVTDVSKCDVTRRAMWRPWRLMKQEGCGEGLGFGRDRKVGEFCVILNLKQCWFYIYQRGASLNSCLFSLMLPKDINLSSQGHSRLMFCNERKKK